MDGDPLAPYVEFLRQRPGLHLAYRLSVRHLGRLPWEVRRIPKPGDYAPQHQFMLAMAMLALDAEIEGRHLRKRAEAARVPPKWRAIHAKVDKAAAVLAAQGW